jgi:integrase
LLRVTSGQEFEHLFTVMLATGLRIGEALGLQWSTDGRPIVHLTTRRLVVRRQVVEIPRQPRSLSEPKFPNGLDAWSR